MGTKSIDTGGSGGRALGQTEGTKRITVLDGPDDNTSVREINKDDFSIYNPDASSLAWTLFVVDNAAGIIRVDGSTLATNASARNSGRILLFFRQTLDLELDGTPSSLEMDVMVNYTELSLKG